MSPIPIGPKRIIGTAVDYAYYMFNQVSLQVKGQQRKVLWEKSHDISQIYIFFFYDSYICVALFCIFLNYLFIKIIFFILVNTVYYSIGKVFLFVWIFDYALKFRGMIWMSMCNGGMIYNDYLVHEYVVVFCANCLLTLLYNHIKDLNLYFCYCVLFWMHIFFYLICALHLGSSYIAHALSRSVAQWAGYLPG